MHVLSRQAIAFDAAVKGWHDFDYRSRADLDQCEPELCKRLTDIRELFNEILAVEGQHITDHAPHPPFYFDYIESDHSNARAFTDGAHSFIGVTVPLINDVSNISGALSASDAVVSSVGLPLTSDRKSLYDAVFWLVLDFVVTHEYSHHVHGHLNGAMAPNTVEEIVGGALTGNLAGQAREADADGYAAYFSLAFWLLDAGGRLLALQFLHAEHLEPEAQDRVLFSCFLVAQAGFTFLREPEALDKDKAYRRTHPPQSLRLHLLTRFVRKWCSEFRPALHTWMTQRRYDVLMGAVSSVMWTSRHAAGWRAQADFLRTAEGVQYSNALIAELDAFRATLHNLGAGASAEETAESR